MFPILIYRKQRARRNRCIEFSIPPCYNPSPQEQKNSPLHKKSGGNICRKAKKSRQPPTFAAFTTIIGAGELDFRVRDGNGYCLTAMATGMLYSNPCPADKGKNSGKKHTSLPPPLFLGSDNMAKPRGLLVPLGCARHRACTCGLSTGCSLRDLRGALGASDVSSRGGLPA